MKKKKPTRKAIEVRAILNESHQALGANPTIKTTVRLPKRIWRDARVRALDQGIDLQDLVAAALVAYLKSPIKGERSR